MTQALLDIPNIVIRPPRPSQRELEEAIAFLYRIPISSVTLLKLQLGKDVVDLLAQAEEFILMLGKLDKGDIDTISLPERRPKTGEYFSYKYGDARWIFDRYSDA